MIRSMTGFGRASTEVEGLDLAVEVKSVNHRFLKLSTRVPEALSGVEAALEGLARNGLKRGAVNINVHLGNGAGEARKYSLNTDVIRRYFLELSEIAGDLKIDRELALEEIARIPGAVDLQESAKVDDKVLLEAAKKAMQEALAGCVASRQEEGAALAADLTRIAESIGAMNKKAEERAPTVVAGYRDRLVERIAKLLDGTKVDIREEDIAREVALFADRSDINEEIQRLGHHVETLISLVNESGDEAGRRLDFIAQEMLREANTMGSKANDGELSSLVLEMKANIEKIKEQVQNVE